MFETRMSSTCSEFPVKTVQASTTIGDLTSVDLVILRFKDRIQISLTAIGKPGIFVEVSSTNTQQLPGSTQAKRIFEIRTLFGQESESLLFLARTIGHKVNAEKPLLLSLGFKDDLSKQEIEHLSDFVKHQLQSL